MPETETQSNIGAVAKQFIGAVAKQFIDLVLGYQEGQELSDDQMKVLSETLTAAGFDEHKAVVGKLKGQYRDQDGPTGDTYPINHLCPVKAVNEEGQDNFLATGWLDQLFRMVLSDGHRKMPQTGIIGKVVEEIKRSKPLELIQLTPEGDMLEEYPPDTNSDWFVEHTRDEKALGTCVGIHKYCRGWMDRHRTTEKHDCIVCRSCHLRVLFPKEIVTYGELREYLRKKLTVRRVFALEPGSRISNLFRRAADPNEIGPLDRSFGL